MPISPEGNSPGAPDTDSSDESGGITTDEDRGALPKTGAGLAIYSLAGLGLVLLGFLFRRRAV